MSNESAPDTQALLKSMQPEHCDCAGIKGLAYELNQAVAMGEIIVEQAVIFYEAAIDQDCQGKKPDPKENFTGCGIDRVCGHTQGPKFLDSLVTKIKANGLPLINIQKKEL
jgi:hypothetical protein